MELDAKSCAAHALWVIFPTSKHSLLAENLYMKQKIQSCIAESSSVSCRFFLFFRWWLVFFCIYSSSAVCPFCGQTGCPVGVGGACLISGFFALLLQRWKTFKKFANKIK